MNSNPKPPQPHGYATLEAWANAIDPTQPVYLMLSRETP